MRATNHSKTHTKRWPLIAGVCFVVILSASGVWWLMHNNTPDKPTAKPVITKKSETKDPSYTLSAMGDMIAHDSLVANAKTGNSYDFVQFFKNTRDTTKADVVFCNPETPVAGDTLGVSGYPTFNAPSAFARDMVRGAGCGLINLATNHMYDKGQTGVDTSRNVWEGLKPLAVSGANSSSEQQNTVSYFEKNGIKTAFVAFADFSNASGFAPYTLNLYHDSALVTKLLTEARKNADVVIVSAHWGTEDSTQVNTDQEKTAKQFAELGADVVIGTGPHVLQKAEVVTSTNGRKTFVWYSLGNFLSTQLKADQLTGGVARLTVTKTKNGVVVDKPTFSPTFMSYDWPAADRAAEKLTTRTNLQLTPLTQSEQRIKAMFPTLSLKERQGYVTKTLGSGVTVIE